MWAGSSPGARFHEPENKLNISPGAKRLYRLLESYGRKNGWISLYHETMARKMRCSETTIRKWLTELRKAGAMESRKRQHSSADYTLFPLVENGRSDGRSDGRSGAVHYKELSLDPELEARGLAFPPPTITNEYGRTDPNPEFEYLSGVLRSALGRIRNARNPVAYERAIVQAELRALRKPAGQEAAFSRAAGRGEA